MEINVPFQNDTVDVKSSLPMPHLSFIIQVLLPKRLVGIHRAELQIQSFSEVSAKDPDLADGFLQPMLVGSVAEGYNIPDVILISNPFKIQTNADADLLLVVPQLPVSNDDLEASLHAKKLMINTQDVHHGYARLEILFPKDVDDVFVSLEESNKTFLSGPKIQKKLFSVLNKETLMLHGPAISTETPTTIHASELQSLYKTGLHSQDYVCALPCTQWPLVGKPWIQRQSDGKWLNQKTIDKIVQSGVHLVPVAHKHSSHPDLEWRISFASSEFFLSNEVITDEQRQCYVFLKIIHYVTLKELDILSSYNWKTVFLYCCEKLPTHAWKDNPGACLLFMIDTMIECINKRNLPSFFIPENNLIDHLGDEQIEEVSRILQSIRKNPLNSVLEFTDTKVMGLQSLSTPFREIVSPVLEDAVEFLVHHDMQRSVMSAYLSSLCKMVYVLIIERKQEEAIRYILDIFPVINRYSLDNLTVAHIVDSIVMNFIPDVQLTVSILEEVLKHSEEYPDVLALRGNLACMFHASAYTHPPDSDERTMTLVQAETLFNTVVDVEDIYSATAVDYSCLLIKMGRFTEATEKLDRFISAELNKPWSTHCFYKKEINVLDETLQKEVNTHDKFAVNSLSMAYYLLVQCVVKHDVSSADPAVYDKILRYFDQHCVKMNSSASYSLLGYSYMMVNDWQASQRAFTKALETCEGSTRLIKENIAYCTKQYQQGSHGI